MTQPAETMGFTAARHLESILHHVSRKTAAGFIDTCIVNNAWIDRQLIARYRLESATPVLADKGSIEQLGVAVVDAPLACINNGVIRHDHMILARIILRLALERSVKSLRGRVVPFPAGLKCVEDE